MRGFWMPGEKSLLRNEEPHGKHSGFMKSADEFKDADEPDEPQRIHNVVRECGGIDGVGGRRRFKP